MKKLLTILFLLLSAIVFGQNADISNTKRFVVGDRIIECSDYKTDFCGNLLNVNGDTIAMNTRPLNSTDGPIYLTKENILLSGKTAKAAIEAKNVKELVVIKCNNGRQVFGDIAKNGIIVVEFIDNISNPIPLTQYIAAKLNLQQTIVKTISINGLLNNEMKLKVNKSDFFEVHYNKNTDSYNVITE